jgi:hypothetical protein
VGSGRKLLCAAVLNVIGFGPLCTAQINSLQIKVLRGEGSFNDIKKKTAEDVVVEVQDELGRPVEGAIVTFLLPSSGPGGTFLDGARMLTMTTSANGRATARSIRPNEIEGRFGIRVTASYQRNEASITVFQSNTAAGGKLVVEEGKKSRKGLWIAILGGGAAAAVAIAVGSRGGGEAKTVVATPPTSVAIGAIAVGGPH